jgi:sulfite oxidase
MPRGNVSRRPAGSFGLRVIHGKGGGLAVRIEPAQSRFGPWDSSWLETLASRREWLGHAVAILAGSAAVGLPRIIRASPDENADPNRLIVRSKYPLDLETPRSALASWRTPNPLFFVRSHLGEPAVALGPWTVSLGGLVSQERTLSLDSLRAMEQVTVPAVLQCSGNGRAFYSPTVPGLPWERGAVGNAEWTGVRLATLLADAGIKAGAKHVHFLGADAPPNPKTPPFLRSLPMEKALEANTILALEMNGEPLPWLHGGPLRLLVPGWTGNHWMKWVRSITVERDEAPGLFQQTAYRLPRKPAPPGATIKPEDLIPLTTLNVKSLVTWPLEGQPLPRGKHTVQGVAWTGEGFVKTVEVAIGLRGGWKPATLLNDERPYAWRQWRFEWNATTRGRYPIRVRATDSLGQTQPEVSPWNRSGYLWNGVDEVRCEIA